MPATPTSAKYTLRIRPQATLGVDKATGRIIGVTDNASQSAAELVGSWTGAPVSETEIEQVSLQADQFLMPGLIDTHTHAPQFTFLGIGHDLPLMDWLNKYTFKHESEFKDTDKAREFYSQVIDRTVRNGVTFAAYYGTIHLEANKILAETIRTKGQRAYVGKVCMDANSPDYYSESTEDSIEVTEDFIKHVLGDQAEHRLYGLPIQSHLCENPSEIEFAKSCFPECRSYAGIYDAFDLFTSRTIMAHCVHMSDEELALMRSRGVGVSHCPNSNFTLSSGIADVRRFIKEGIPVGLGTDVSGGYTPSMLDAMRMAAAANRALTALKRDRGDKLEGRDAVPLEAAEAVFLATQGGARVMGMDDELGSLEPGKLFDALVVDLSTPLSPVPSIASTPAQFVFLADDRNVAQVYVNGKQIHSST
ncbi:Metallo-dependent hydrolase [Linderina pennispora]|uniref:Metallo-dependent hydrolase n=1 Tax=Linderina pennispora TaxID=61395 RepID=A0A1Y1WGS2_9FUNG|nr:Metallo-dependent hydrolase [Linderina pennispora]ORX72751.1 Metallo-dependent hydrolase [Linderina pennispora]